MRHPECAMYRFLLFKASSSLHVYPQRIPPTSCGQLFRPRKLHSYANLHEACLRNCEQVKTHHLFDEMPCRLTQFSTTSKIIHSRSIKLGFMSKGPLGNAVLDLYAKCGDVGSARKVFDRLEMRNAVAWNSMLSMYSKRGDFELVLVCFGLFWNSGLKPNEYTCSIVLSGCARSEDVISGKEVHCIVLKMGLQSSFFCQGSLIDMYAKCEHVVDARQVFDGAAELDTVSWTSMIAGYFRAGLTVEAIQVFEQMNKVGHPPDQVAIVTAMNAYVGLGRLVDATNLFSRISKPNVVAWNVMISGHAQRGHEVEAIKFYQVMRKSGTKSTRSTFGSILCAIANVGTNNYGLLVHAEAIKQGLHSNVYVGSSLINMYSKCKNVEAAQKVFDDLDERNVVLWNAMLGGYTQNGKAYKVVELFFNMKHSGLQPDEFTFTSILSACAGLEYLEVGHWLHSIIIKNRFSSNLFVGNALVDMYAKCGVLEDARKLFERIQNRDDISWNAIIVGYVQEHDVVEAFHMFQRMISLGILPTEVSLSSILSACANMKGIEQGKQIHCLSVKCGLETNLYTGSSLISMYSKCGAVDLSKKIFSCMPEKNLESMNAIIGGLASSNPEEAIIQFRRILDQGLRPSEITFASLLDACNDPQLLNLGMEFHCMILKSGLQHDDDFLGVALLGMYMNCLRKTEATCIFSQFSKPKSTVMWTSMISGLAQHNCSEEALEYFKEMRSCNALPDQATFVSVLRASAILSSIECGRQIHALIFHRGFDLDELTCSSLVDMYAKCGDVASSKQVFEEMESKENAISWNSMIVGLAKNGFAEDALRVFELMMRTQVMSNDVTFLGALTACSHTGRVSEGRLIFDAMVTHFQIQPSVDHYACMVDILGRWGFLQEAEEFINKLSFAADAKIWATMLGACTIHGDDSRGQRAAEKLIALEPQNSSAYTLLSNIHAASGNWDDVKIVRKVMREKGIRKLPGCSWIDVGQKTNLFIAGDDSHPCTGEIYEVLSELMKLAKDDHSRALMGYFFLEEE